MLCLYVYARYFQNKNLKFHLLHKTTYTSLTKHVQDLNYQYLFSPTGFIEFKAISTKIPTGFLCQKLTSG